MTIRKVKSFEDLIAEYEDKTSELEEGFMPSSVFFNKIKDNLNNPSRRKVRDLVRRLKIEGKITWFKGSRKYEGVERFDCWYKFKG